MPDYYIDMRIFFTTKINMLLRPRKLNKKNKLNENSTATTFRFSPHEFNETCKIRVCIVT